MGVTLPQFGSDAEWALAVAARAEACGLDGVFVFDHLWPMGNPNGQVLHGLTLLAALAEHTAVVAVGSLVARVGLVSDEVLVDTLATIHDIAGGRLVAGLGVGDSLSRDENLASGIAYPPLGVRLTSLSHCLDGLAQAGVRTWVGGRAPALMVAAERAGGWNGWELTSAALAAAGEGFAARGQVGSSFEITWGGQVVVAADQAAVDAVLDRRRAQGRSWALAGTPRRLAAQVSELSAAGASWVVCSPAGPDGYDSGAVELLAEVRRLAR